MILIKIRVSIVIIVFTVITLITTLQCNAQDARFEWAKQIAGFEQAHGNAITKDLKGNILITGFLNGNTVFNPGSDSLYLTGFGNWDVFIAKYDPKGNLLWAKNLGSTGSDEGLSISSDIKGDIIVTGGFAWTVDFDPGPAVYNLTGWQQDLFILKLDSDGNFIWAKKIGNVILVANSTSPSSANTDIFGNVCITGAFQGKVDFDPGPGVFNLICNKPSMFVLKLDANGNFVWAKLISSNWYICSESIAIDESCNIYSTGCFQRTVDFDPDPDSFFLTSQIGNANGNAFILKLDSAGNFVWAKQIEGKGWSEANSIALDKKGDVYTTGIFRDTADFNPGTPVYNLNAHATTDVFILKLDKNGNFIWVDQISDGDIYGGLSISTDADGNVFSTGEIDNFRTIDFDPGKDSFNLLFNSGFLFSYILKLNTNGDFIWVKSIEAESNSITIDTIGNIYTLGDFRVTADFDPGAGVYYLTHKWSERDAFILKLKPCLSSSSTITDTALCNYSINGEKYISSGIYKQYLTNITGCDSIITLNLTINKLTTYSSLTDTACFNYYLNGEEFSTNGVYKQTLTNSIGCDSILTLYLTINKVNLSVSESDTVLFANESGASYQWLDCDNQNKPILGETNQSIKVKKNGRYAVIVTNNGCTDTSDCYNISTFKFYIRLYPNPTTGKFYIDFGDVTSSATIEIIDVLGRIVSLNTINEVIKTELILNKPAGVYFVSIITDKIKATYKLVVQ